MCRAGFDYMIDKNKKKIRKMDDMSERELQENSVRKKFLRTAADGKNQ